MADSLQLVVPENWNADELQRSLKQSTVQQKLPNLDREKITDTLCQFLDKALSRRRERKREILGN